MDRALIVDDVPQVRRRIAAELQGLGAEIVEAEDGLDALAALERTRVDVIVSDVRMPRMDGLALLRALRPPEPPVILHSGYADVQAAVEGLRLGAVDYLPAPLDPQRLRARVLHLLRRKRGCAQDLLGDSPETERLRSLIARVAIAREPVLITGETGSGKEVVARAIHSAGERAGGPFVAVNVCALSDGVLESELFGHERGAFTGAVARRRGRFELAEGGTLLLDEIGDAPPSLQAKLLRAVETGCFERVGGVAPIRVDVRILAATHHDLPAEIARGRFREDLWYRLSALRVHIAPLRERPADVEVIAGSELAQLSAERGSSPFELDAAGMALLRSYRWRGNVRELRLTVRRMAILAGERRLLGAQDVEQALEIESSSARSRSDFEERDRRELLRVLASVRWNVSLAARQLGASRGALRGRMKHLGLEA